MLGQRADRNVPADSEHCRMRMCRRMAVACLSMVWLALWLVAPVARAAEAIDIRSPYVTPTEGVYVLNAQLQFDVPEQVERAVRDGVTLNLELDIRVSRSRSWWRDEVLAQLQQRYELLYHGVSERYLVRNVNSGEQSSYASFAHAIASLQRIESLPVLDQALLTPDVRNEVSLRAQIEARSIPRALGLLLFWVDSYSLESDWYTWPMKP